MKIIFSLLVLLSIPSTAYSNQPNAVEVMYTNYFYSAGIKRDSVEGKKLYTEHKKLSLLALKKIDYMTAYLDRTFDIQEAFNNNLEGIFRKWNILYKKNRKNALFNDWFKKEEELFEKYVVLSQIEGGYIASIRKLGEMIEDRKDKDRDGKVNSIETTEMYGQMVNLLAEYMEFWRLKRGTLIEASFIIHIAEQNDKNKIINIIKNDLMPLYIDEIKLKVYLDVYFDAASRVYRSVGGSLVKLIEFDLRMLDDSIEKLETLVGNLDEALDKNSQNSSENYYKILEESRKHYSDLLKKAREVRNGRAEQIDRMQVTRKYKEDFVLPASTAPAGLGSWLKNKISNAYEGTKSAISSAGKSISYGVDIVKGTVKGTVKDIADNAGYVVDAAGMTFQDITGVKPTDKVSITNVGKAIITTGVNVVKATYEGVDIVTKTAGAFVYEKDIGDAWKETKKAFNSSGNKGAKNMGQGAIQKSVKGLEWVDKQVNDNVGPVGKFVWDATPVGAGLGMGKDFSTLLDNSKTTTDKAIAAVSMGLNFLGTGGGKNAARAAGAGVKNAVVNTADDIGKAIAKQKVAKTAANDAARSFWKNVWKGGKDAVIKNVDYGPVLNAKNNLQMVKNAFAGEVRTAFANGARSVGAGIKKGAKGFVTGVKDNLDSLFGSTSNYVKDMVGKNGIAKFGDFWKGQLEGATVKDLIGWGLGGVNDKNPATTVQMIDQMVNWGKGLGNIPDLVNNGLDLVRNLDSQFNNWYNSFANGSGNQQNDRGAYDYANRRREYSNQQSQTYRNMGNQYPSGGYGQGGGFRGGGMAGVSAADMANLMTTTSQASWNAYQRERAARRQREQAASSSSSSSGSSAGTSSSCPYVLAAISPGKYVLDNDIFSVARWNPSKNTVPEKISYMDNYLLKISPKRIKTSYRIRIKEIREEKSYIDYISLEAIDIPKAWKAAIDSKGNVFRYKNLKPSPLEKDILLYNGDSITVTLDDLNPKRGSLVMLIDIKGFIKNTDVTAVPLDEKPGIIVQAKNTFGGWKTIGHIYPRQNTYTAAVDVSSMLKKVSGVKVRLLSRSCLTNTAHLVKIKGYTQTVPGDVTTRKLNIKRCVYGALDISVAVSEVDRNYFMLSPGRKIDIEFSAPVKPAGYNRFFILKTKGYYKTLPFSIARVSTTDLAVDQYGGK